MKKFTFPLEAVLIVRRSERSKAQKDYLEALGKHRKLRLSENEARIQIEKMMEKMNENRLHTFSVQSQNFDLDMLSNSFSNLRTLNDKLLESEHNLNKYLEQFLLSKQKEKLLNKLRKKRLDSFNKEMERNEEKQIEELVNTRQTANAFFQ